MAWRLQPRPGFWPPAARVAFAVGFAALVLLALGRWGPARRPPPTLLLSGDGHEYAYARAAERLIAGAHTRIWMLMFVIRPEDKGEEGPVGGLLQALADAAARGVHVQVALDLGENRPGEPRDDKHVAAYAWLKSHGVHVLLDEATRTTHAKVIIIDDATVLMGSHNWTRSAIVANREASVILDDPGIARDLEDYCAGVPGWDRNW
jgi:phosphatidylserine/phosphatidylglycerophosphate/cardiolipin synthase-like enzyme